MKKWIFFLIAWLLLSYSCKKNNPSDCFLSTGKVVEETREIGVFNRIVLKDNVNLHLTQGSENKLIVKAGSHLMKKIITRTTADSCLEIANLNRCNWVRSYKVPIDVYLTFTDLNLLEYYSIGTVDNTDTLRLDSLKINVHEGGGVIRLCVNTHELFTNIFSGTATIECSGNIGLSFVYSGGFGLIDNRNLFAKMVYLLTKSSNDVYIRASVTIATTIDNIGNVYYYGHPPNISHNGTGTGKLIRLGD